MDRFALKITDEVLEYAAQISGGESADLGDHTIYLVIEVLSPTEFKATLTTEEQVVEEYKTNPDLHIM